MIGKLAGVFWGIVMIAGGSYALAQSLGYVGEQSPTVWAIIFAGISVVSLIFYFAEGVKEWGWLFPAGIFGALAILMALAARGIDSPVIAAPLFIGIGLPFVVAYIIDRAQNWWALIPAGVMAFLTLVLLAVDKVRGEWIGAALFFVLAVTFLLVYVGRRATWAAIVAYVMFVLGFTPLLGMTSTPELAGVLIFFAIGLPFLFIYLRSPARWWAIIPAGILLTLGIVTAIVLLPGVPAAEYDSGIANSIVFTGTAITFAIVWLRHHKRWGMLLAIVSALAAIAALVFPDMNIYGPLILMAAGVFVLYSALRRRPA